MSLFEERLIQYSKLGLLFLILLAMLFGARPAKAQNPSVIQPNCIVGFNFTATGRSTAYQNITPQGVPTKACTSWTLIYSNTGFASLSIEIDSAPDAGATPGVSPGSWTVWPSSQVAAGQVLPSTATTSAGVTVFGFFPWVSVNLNSVTGTGTVSGFLYGWQTQGSQESNTGATQVQGVTSVGSAPSTGNPVQIAWGAPTKPFTCTVTLSTNTTTQCQAAPAAGLRNYISSWLIQTNTAGTATALNLTYGTGANCGTGTTTLSAAFANTATNTATPANLSPLTPWQPAAANAVCVTQAGTTAGTSVVELHGFIAP